VISQCLLLVLLGVVYTLAADDVPVKEATSPVKKAGDLQTDSSVFYGYAPYGIGYGYGGGLGGFGGYGKANQL
jgi:hypothetical protein